MSFGDMPHCTESRSSNGTGGRCRFLPAPNSFGQVILLTVHRAMSSMPLLGGYGRCNGFFVRISLAGFCCLVPSRPRVSILSFSYMSTGPTDYGTTSTLISVVPNGFYFSRSVNRMRLEYALLRSLWCFDEPVGREELSDL